MLYLKLTCRTCLHADLHKFASNLQVLQVRKFKKNYFSSDFLTGSMKMYIVSWREVPVKGICKRVPIRTCWRGDHADNASLAGSLATNWVSDSAIRTKYYTLDATLLDFKPRLRTTARESKFAWTIKSVVFNEIFLQKRYPSFTKIYQDIPGYTVLYLV